MQNTKEYEKHTKEKRPYDLFRIVSYVFRILSCQEKYCLVLFRMFSYFVVSRILMADPAESPGHVETPRTSRTPRPGDSERHSTASETVNHVTPTRTRLAGPADPDTGSP